MRALWKQAETARGVPHLPSVQLPPLIGARHENPFRAVRYEGRLPAGGGAAAAAAASGRPGSGGADDQSLLMRGLAEVGFGCSDCEGSEQDAAAAALLDGFGMEGGELPDRLLDLRRGVHAVGGAGADLAIQY